MPDDRIIEPEGALLIRQGGDSLARIAAECQAIYADSVTAATESTARSIQFASELTDAWLQAWYSPEAGRKLLNSLFEHSTRVLEPAIACATDVPERLFRAIAD